MKLSVNTYITILGKTFTVKDKNGRWHIGYSHKEKRVSRSTGLEATKQNLQLVKKEVLSQVAQELISSVQSTSSEDTTDETILDNFAELYFALHKEVVRDHVYERNLRNFKRHILPYFKGRNLNSIKAIELEQWQNRLLSKYKPSSVQKYRSIFYGIFTKALQNELITKIPLSIVTAPKIKATFNRINESESINPFTQKEVDILVASDKTYMSNYILLMASTGARPGEIISFKWKDINFENRTINIDKTTVNGVCGLPKTPSSVRVIDMIQGAYDALQAQFLLTGGTEYVFTNSKNERFYSHDIINLNLRARLIANNIEVRSLYQLRHHFASKMIKNGVAIPWVSATLGHLDSSITLKIYTKYIKEDDEARNQYLAKINLLLKEAQ